MDVNGDREGDFSLMSMTNVEAGTYEVKDHLLMLLYVPLYGGHMVSLNQLAGSGQLLWC